MSYELGYGVPIEAMLINQTKAVYDDKIKYNFEAFPHGDYGHLTGEITNISVDSLVSENQNVYKVSATLNETIAQSYNGEVSQVKVGMSAEAQIITDEKSILRFLLEKINLVD